MAKKKRVIGIVVIILCILLMCISGMFIVRYLNTGKTETDKYKVEKPTASGELPDNPIDFKKLQADNPDICGWIYIPNTRVEYPILQSSTQDDNYYLSHDYLGKAKFAGSIYIQRLNSKFFTDANTVLYGHNMKNGSMFRDLRLFRDKTFFEQNRYIYVYIPGHILTYDIFSAYRYDDRHILNSFDFNDMQVYADYLLYATNPTSSVKNVRDGVNVTNEDKIITLSTCMNNGKNRYLVQGVLVKDERTK